jgi:hypothetical protein
VASFLFYKKRDNRISNEQAVLVPVGTQYVREKRDLSFLFATKLDNIRAFFFFMDEVHIKENICQWYQPCGLLFRRFVFSMCPRFLSCRQRTRKRNGGDDHKK